MKNFIKLFQFLSLIYLTNCLPNLFDNLPKLPHLDLDLLKDFLKAADHLPQALTGFSLVSCPSNEEPSIDFTWEDFSGTWYEVERTALFEILETGQKCTEITFSVEGKSVKLNTTVISTVLNVPITDIKTIDIKDQSNVFDIKTGLIEKTKFWVVDTDLDSYALIFSCKEFLHASLRNAWILGRKPTLDQSTRDQLIKKLGTLGIPESSLIASDQSCSSFIPIR